MGAKKLLVEGTLLKEKYKDMFRGPYDYIKMSKIFFLAYFSSRIFDKNRIMSKNRSDFCSIGK